MRMSADLRGFDAYAGSVAGILQAMEDPRYEGLTLSRVQNAVEKGFYVSTLAMHAANPKRLKHVFDWGRTLEGTSSKPLFKVVSLGSSTRPVMSYVFLPSTRYVPLPDPIRIS